MERESFPLVSRRGTAQGKGGQSKGCEKGTISLTIATDETRAPTGPKAAWRGETRLGATGSSHLPEPQGEEPRGLAAWSSKSL